MTTYAITRPFEVFTDINGEPLEAGYIYIGEANQNPITNQIGVFWDSEFIYPAAQPIRTLAGYASRNGTPGNLFINLGEDPDYSILIKDKNGQLVFSSPAAISSGAYSRLSSVDTLTDLRAIDGFGSAILVLGHTAKGDGAGGIFNYFDGAAPGTYVDDNGYTIIPTGGDGSAAWLRPIETYIELKKFGAIGDYTTDDTDAIDNWLGSWAIYRVPLLCNRGVYRYTRTIELPESIKIIGEDAPVITAFPQNQGDKSLLRPGYKDQISGSSIIFDGTGGTTSYTTNRSDGFASIEPMVLYDYYAPYRIEKIAFIQDMDVLDVGGGLTTGATDNRATAYTCGFVDTSTLSTMYAVCIFGYFEDSGLVIHSEDGDTADPDYLHFIDCNITSGIAIIGHDTAAGAASEGLTGSKWTGCRIFGADHHTRADGLYTVPAVYIDGFISSVAAGIRGHSFTNCNFRTYANDAIVLDHTNDIQFLNSVWEFSLLAGVTDADALGGFVGTANTKDIVIVGGAGTSDPKLNTFLTQIAGNYLIGGAGSFGKVIIGEGQNAIRIAGDETLGDSYIQMTTDISSVSTGWKIQRDGSASNNLVLRWDNTEVGNITNAGNINSVGDISADGDVSADVDINAGNDVIAGNLVGHNVRARIIYRQQIGAIAIASGVAQFDEGYSDIILDTEASSASDDLDTLTMTSGTLYRGQMITIRQNVSTRDIVFKHTTGNIRCEGAADFTLTAGTEMAFCYYDGSSWRCWKKTF
jgi:hypothetical protein